MDKRQAQKYLQDTARLFAERVRSDEWPARSCDSCTKLGYCCQRHHHHHGDICLHCGNDERDPRRWPIPHAFRERT